MVGGLRGGAGLARFANCYDCGLTDAIGEMLEIGKPAFVSLV